MIGVGGMMESFVLILSLKVRIRARNRRGWSPLSKLLEFETTFEGDIFFEVDISDDEDFIFELSLLVTDKETVQMFWPEGFNRAQSFSSQFFLPLLLTLQMLS